MNPAFTLFHRGFIFKSPMHVRQWLRSLADQVKETAPFEFISLDHIRRGGECAVFDGQVEPDV